MATPFRCRQPSESSGLRARVPHEVARPFRIVCGVNELEAAWAAVHEALPEGWSVMHPSYHVEDRQWHVFAADHRRGRTLPDYIEATGENEAHALRGLAELLRVWRLRPIEAADG